MGAVKADNYAKDFSDIHSLLEFTRAIWLGECYYMQKRCCIDKVKSATNKIIGLRENNTPRRNDVEQEELNELVVLMEFEKQFSALLAYSEQVPLDKISRLSHFYRVIRIEEILKKYQVSSYAI